MPKDNSARGKGRNYDPTAAPKKRSRFGKEAGEQAGRMKQPGRMWLLLPPEAAPK